MLASVDVCGHNGIVCSVQEDFPQQLDRLAFCHVRIGGNELVVIAVEEQFEVDAQIFRDYALVFGDDLLSLVSALNLLLKLPNDLL